MTDFFDTFGPSFLGLQILRLYSLIDRGGTDAMLARSLDLPSQVASLLVFLRHHGASSASELARALGTSHQLVGQRISIVEKRGLIQKFGDPQDGRRTLIRLNAAGRRAAEDIETLCRIGDEAYRRLFEEIGVDLCASVIEARKALEERSLALRIRDISESVGSRPKSDRNQSRGAGRPDPDEWSVHK